MTPVEALTHDEIAEIGANWLKNNQGYPFTFSNMTSAMHGEQPDALGISTHGESFLLEAKVSRADFRADLKKPWRTGIDSGLGMYRGYITPKGLLKPEEIPYGWWLLEIHGKNKPIVKVVKGWARITVKKKYGTTTEYEFRHMDVKEREFFAQRCEDYTSNYSFRSELMWFIKIMKRAQQDGVDLQRYANGKVVNEKLKTAV